MGPVLEITTSCLYGKHGVEIRIWSLSEDNTQSWVRICDGSNKFVIDSNNNTEISDDLPEEQASQLKMKDFACRSESAMMCFLPLEPKQTVIVTHALECATTLLMRGAGSHNSSARVSQMCPSILYPLHACHSHGELGTSLQARRIQQSLH